MKISHFDFIKDLKAATPDGDEGWAYLTIPETPQEQFIVDCSISKQAPVRIWLFGHKKIPVETQEQVWAIHDKLREFIRERPSLAGCSRVGGCLDDLFIERYLWKNRAFYKQVFGRKPPQKSPCRT